MRPNNRFNQQSKRCNTGQTIHCCGKNCTTDPKKTIEKLSEKFICANLCTECHVANEGKNGRHEISLLAEEIRRAHGFQIDIDFIDRFSLRSMSNVASRLKRRKTLEHDFLSHIIWKSKPNQSNPNSTRADANERARSDFFFFWFLVTHFHHFVHFLLADTITHTLQSQPNLPNNSLPFDRHILALSDARDSIEIWIQLLPFAHLHKQFLL